MRPRSRDRRDQAAILSDPRWDPFLAAVPVGAMIEEGRLTLRALREADRFLAWAEKHAIAAIDEQAVQAYCAGRHSPGIPILLRKAFRVLAAGDPAIEVFERITRRRMAEAKVRKAEAAWPTGGPSADRTAGRALRVSVPETALPTAWRAALTAMRDDEPGEAIAAPAPTITESVARQMRQFALSARLAGLPMAMERAQLKAHLAVLRARKLRPGTMMAATSRLLTFQLYTAPHDPITHTVRRIARRWEARANHETPLREQQAARLPGLAGIQKQAAALLQKSFSTQNPRSAQHERNAALALAFPTLLPLRLADLTLAFGVHITWDGRSWVLDTVISKSRFEARPYKTRIDPWLTPFIDAVVLQGAAPDNLAAMRARCIAHRRRVFVDRNGQPCTYGYVSRMWKRYVGTGAHVVRSLVHDDRGAEGDAGVRDALLVCGQTSMAIAKVYQTRAHDRRAVATVQSAIAAALDDSTLREFE